MGVSGQIIAQSPHPIGRDAYLKYSGEAERAL